MAEKLDISQAAYSKLEKIAEVLEINPNDITNFDNQKVLNSYNNSIIGNNSNYNDVKIIRQLYEDKIALLEKLLNNAEAEIERLKNK